MCLKLFVSCSDEHRFHQSRAKFICRNLSERNDTTDMRFKGTRRQAGVPLYRAHSGNIKLIEHVKLGDSLRNIVVRIINKSAKKKWPCTLSKKQ